MDSSLHAVLRSAGLQPPELLTLAITGVCNLACPHCWVESGSPASPGHVPESHLFKLIDEHAALGGSGIRLTGGEPLGHPACLRLLARARSAGFDTLLLQTNGLLVDQRVAAALQRVDFPGLRIEISLDGASPAAHDAVRGPGSFDALMDRLALLKQCGLQGRVTLLFTEMRHNLEEFPRLLALADEYGAGAVLAGTLIAGGRAGAGSPVAPPLPAQYLALAEQLLGDPGFSARYGRIGSMAALEWLRGDALRDEEYCTFAAHPYLCAEGRLYPCRMCHSRAHSVGGVHRKGLRFALLESVPLWSALMEISARRKSCAASCSCCSEADCCAAGCMGRALASTGDPLAPDDRCAIRCAIARLRTLHPFHFPSR